MEHEKLKVGKRKEHKTFLDSIRGSPQHERRKEKKSELVRKKGLKNSSGI